jgi:hypothetical protein
MQPLPCGHHTGILSCVWWGRMAQPDAKLAQLVGQPGEMTFRKGQTDKQFEEVCFEGQLNEVRVSLRARHHDDFLARPRGEIALACLRAFSSESCSASQWPLHGKVLVSLDLSSQTHAPPGTRPGQNAIRLPSHSNPAAVRGHRRRRGGWGGGSGRRDWSEGWTPGGRPPACYRE